MGFGDELGHFHLKTAGALRAVFQESVFSAHRSIVQGSPLTGAPGQPVDTGRLRQSWQIEQLSRDQVRILTSLKYARSIEDGLSYAHAGKPITLRSQVGGFHSLKLTVQNWDRIVFDAATRVSRSPRFGPGGRGGAR